MKLANKKALIPLARDQGLVAQEAGRSPAGSIALDCAESLPQIGVAVKQKTTC